jgi:hypothetical protein
MGANAAPLADLLTMRRLIAPGAFVVAAAAWGVWTRVLFFRSFPDPLPTPDTWSYLTGIYGLLEKGEFSLATFRTPGFPILVWLTLVAFKSFAALTLLQGVLTFGSALAVGLVTRAFGGSWRLPAALGAGLVVVNPHLLYWEHFVITEATFQAALVLSVGATALAVLKPTPLRAGIAGLVTAVAVLIRPQGIVLIPVVLLAVALAARRLGARKSIALVAAAGAGSVVVLGGWSLRNAAVHGFFGIEDMGPQQLFGVSARWIDLENPALAEAKALIADRIRRYLSMPDDADWAQYSPDGPGYLIWHKYGVRRNEIYKALAREAILQHPGAFIARGFFTAYTMLTSRVDHGGNFAATAQEESAWADLAKEFPVDQHRAALDQGHFPADKRIAAYRRLRRAFKWETAAIRTSLGATVLALLVLPLLRGPRRLATALAVTSVVLLILTAGLFSVATDRYLSILHGGAALAGALALAGLLERRGGSTTSRGRALVHLRGGTAAFG